MKKNRKFQHVNSSQNLKFLILGPIWALFGFKKPRKFFSNNLAQSLFKLEDTLGVRNQKFSKSSSGENLGTNVQTDGQRVFHGTLTS